MKAKVIIILSTVAVLHLVLGGMFLTGGCAPEEPPMPPGIYVPQPTSKVSVPGETAPEAVGPAPGTAEFKEQVSQKEEPFELPPAVETVTKPAPEKKAEPEKPAPAITDKDTTYVVRKGDSLWKISRTYGISIAELAAYNNIAPSKPIKIGQKLIIPAGSNAVKGARTAPATDKKAVKKKAAAKKTAGKKNTGKAEKVAVPADGVYIVKEGDSFSRIAAKYHVRVADIEAANPGVSSNRLQIGQKLNLPTGKTSAAPAGKAKAKVPVQQEKKALPVNEDILLDDIPNPDAVPAPAVNAPAPAPEVEQAVAPVADKPLASEDAVKAVLDTNQPAVNAADPQSLTDTAVPTADTTIDAIAAKYGVKADDIKTLNPALPADGKVKAGTVVQLP